MQKMVVLSMIFHDLTLQMKNIQLIGTKISAKRFSHLKMWSKSERRYTISPSTGGGGGILSLDSPRGLSGIPGLKS